MIPTLNKIQQAKDGAKLMIDEITKKYHEDFDKIEAEFKAKAKYINELEDRIIILEKKVGELEKDRETKTNTI
jgi:hypothetical protein